MKILSIILSVSLVSLISTFCLAQEEIQTVFKSGRSGGYGAISNKFSTINGEFANINEIYGGWFINKKFLLGLGGGATSNYIPVPLEFSESPTDRMSYLYGQFGMVNEFVIRSNKAVHVVFHLFNGAGYTMQYERAIENYNGNNNHSHDHSENINWFFVTEPGLQVEVNLLKWMRFSPGVSYRYAQGSKAADLKDNDISGTSLNMTLKFGKF